MTTLTVTNLTPSVQFIGSVVLEPFSTKTADFNDAALSAAQSRNIVTVKNTTETFQSTRAKIVEDSSSTYTLRAQDENSYRRFGNDVSVDVTVESFVVSGVEPQSQFHFKQCGDGQITYVAGAGVTINSSETLKSRKIGSAQTLIYIGNNIWDLIGDVEASA